MSFVYVKALDDIRMVEGPQYFYFILQHLHTRRTIVLEVYHFDCALTTGSTVNSSIYDAAETLTYFFTDIVYICSDAFLLREELRTIRDPHSRDTAPQLNLFGFLNVTTLSFGFLFVVGRIVPLLHSQSIKNTMILPSFCLPT
jgi:hypothetical protein